MGAQGRALAWALLGASAMLSWISGCSDLENDCQLLVNCPDTKDPPQCSGQLYSPKCDSCLQAHCCQEVSDCLGNNPCGTYCMFGIMPPAPECNTGPTGVAFGGLTSCLKTNCVKECGEISYCNPVTHNGCMIDGSQCEMIYPGIFTCVPPGPAPAQLCQPCSFIAGPYCGSGLRCDVTSLQCGRYCCNDTDCGTGHCELNQNVVFGYSTINPADMVGLCLANAPATGPACDAVALPFPPASGGKCFQGFAP